MKILNIKFHFDNENCQSKCKNSQSNCGNDMQNNQEKKCCFKGCFKGCPRGCFLTKFVQKLKERSESCAVSKFILCVGIKLKNFFASVFNLCLKLILFPIKLAFAIFFIGIAISACTKISSKLFDCCNKHKMNNSAFQQNFSKSYSCSKSYTDSEIKISGNCVDEIYEKLAKEYKGKNCSLTKNEEGLTIKSDCVKKIKKEMFQASSGGVFSIKMPDFELLMKE